MSNQREIGSIDWLKGFSIFLVVFGHFYASTFVVPGFAVARRVVYLFHMPVFMAVSGCLFALSGRLPIGAFLVKKFQRLMIPYLMISALVLVAKSVACELSFPLQRAVTRTDWLAVALYPHHGFALFLWYLYTLFIIFALVRVLQQFRAPHWLIALLALGARFAPLPRVLCLDLVGVNWIYFVLGMALVPLVKRDWAGGGWARDAVVVVTWGLFVTLSWWLMRQGGASRVLSLATSLVGVLASWLTALHPALGRSVWIRRLGRSSASIYLLHTLVMGLIRYVWEVQVGVEGVWTQGLFFVSAIGLGVWVPMRLQETFFVHFPRVSRCVLGMTARPPMD